MKDAPTIAQICPNHYNASEQTGLSNYRTSNQTKKGLLALKTLDDQILMVAVSIT